MVHPLISVVMPVYNAENYLEHALKSILSQKDDRIEVIAIDGGSTDRTVSILERYADRLPMKLLRREDCGSWMAKTNLGLSQARGEFVCFLHHDDLWLDDRLQVLRSLVHKTPDATMFLHASWFIDAHGRQVGLWRCPLPADCELGADFVINRLLVQNFISIPAPLFSREAALRVGGLDEALWYTADWDFWLKLAAAGKTVYHPMPLAAFRIHPHSQTMQGSCQIGDFRRQHELVVARHLNALELDYMHNRMRRRIIHYSIEVNTALAAYVHGRKSHWLHLISRFIALGPLGSYRYLRDSRIIERTLPRYRIGLASRQTIFGECLAKL
jgi:glycosyltransferase involved in cell wall biosynthesis